MLEQGGRHAARSSAREVITTARRTVLELLATYTYLRTEHFYELMGAQGETRRRAVRRILTHMRRQGYVTMQPLFNYREHVRGGYPHTEFVYYLTQKGAAHVRSESQPSHRSPGSLLHDVAVSEFHLALHRAISRIPHARLHWLTGHMKKTVNPDAVFGLEDTRQLAEKSTFWFFLELERSPQGHWRPGEDSALLQKLKRYAQYRGTPEQRRDWPFIGDFRVIVAVPTERRAANLIEKLRRTMPLRMVWIGSTADADTDILNSPLHCPADRSGAVRSLGSLIVPLRDGRQD